MGNRSHVSIRARIRAYATVRLWIVFPKTRHVSFECASINALVHWRMDPAKAKQWPTIKTTLPRLPPFDERQTTTTERLVLRPFNDDSHDLAALHALHRDDKMMRWSPQGEVDPNMVKTYVNHLQYFVPPLNAANLVYAIILKSTGEFIGYGGICCLPCRLGWPEMNVFIKSDLWGQGYGTEFLETLLEIWRALPREIIMTKVHENTVYGDREIKDECLAGVPTYDNMACHRLLEKSGLEKRAELDEFNGRSKETDRRHGWVTTKSNANLKRRGRHIT